MRGEGGSWRGRVSRGRVKGGRVKGRRRAKAGRNGGMQEKPKKKCMMERNEI